MKNQIAVLSLRKFGKVVIRMKKFFGALLIGAFVFGLGATDTASAAKPEYGSKNPYDSRAYEFGLGSSDQYQNLAKPEYGSKNPYDNR